MAQRLPLAAAERPRAQGGQLTAEIGLVERSKGDFQPCQTRVDRQKLDFGWNAAEHEMRMRLAGLNEAGPAGLERRVTGLDRLLRKR